MPIFNTPTDTSNALEDIEIICQLKNWSYKKMDILSRLDFALYSNENFFGYLETKRRVGKNNKYYEQFISADKIEAGKRLCSMAGVKLFVSWCWSDAIWLVEVDFNKSYPCKIAGRTVQTRPNAAHDIEAMYYFNPKDDLMEKIPRL